GDVTGGAGMSGGGSASPSDGLGWRGVVGLVGIPFQLVSLATFGSYGMELDLGFFGSMAVGWRGLPLLITSAMVATAFLATRFVQRRWGSTVCSARCCGRGSPGSPWRSSLSSPRA